MANEDPIKARLETRLARMGMALKAAQRTELQRLEIKHRLDEKEVPARVEEQFRNIIDGMKINLEELYGYIDREFQETRRERWPAKN